MFKKLLFLVAPVIMVSLVALYISLMQWNFVKADFIDSGYLSTVSQEKAVKKEMFTELNSYSVEFENSFLGKRTEIMYAPSKEILERKVSSTVLFGTDVFNIIATISVIIFMVIMLVYGSTLFACSRYSELICAYYLIVCASSIVFINSIPILVFI